MPLRRSGGSPRAGSGTGGAGETCDGGCPHWRSRECRSPRACSRCGWSPRSRCCCSPAAARLPARSRTPATAPPRSPSPPPSEPASSALLTALVWPLLVRRLLLVPALVLGLLVFFLNGSLLLVALRLNPSGRGEAAPETAVVVAAVMSAASSATSTALAVRDDDAYRRRLSRLADRRRRARPGGPRRRRPRAPSSSSSTASVTTCSGRRSERDRPLMPTVAGLGRTATHRLTPWRTDWSSQTGASQLGILHGTNHDVPGLPLVREGHRRGHGQQPAHQRGRAPAPGRRTEPGRAGCSTVDGASRGNLFSGGADELPWSCRWPSGAAAGRTAPAPGYFAYFSDPANAVRTALSFVAEVCREIGQSTARPAAQATAPGQARRALPVHPRLRDRRRTGRRGRRGDGRHARRPHRRLRRPGRLRRGRPPLRAAQPGRPEGAAPGSTAPSR